MQTSKCKTSRRDADYVRLGPFSYGGGFGCQKDATGLKLLGHRLYDSSTDRFLTRNLMKMQNISRSSSRSLGDGKNQKCE